MQHPLPRLLSFGIIHATIIHVLASDPSIVPLELQRSLPPCAYDCAQAEISQAFTPFVCPVPTKVDCFCSQYAQAGPVLGDIVFQCYYTACYNETPPSDHSTYDYCTSQTSSTTTSLTTSSPPSSSPPISTPSVAALAFSDYPTTTMSDPSPTLDDPFPSSALPATLVTATDPPSTSPNPTTPALAASSPTATSTKNAAGSLLSPGQIAGITVAAVVAAVCVYIILGTIFNSCRKRRHESRSNPKPSNDKWKPGRFGGLDSRTLSPCHVEKQFYQDPVTRRTPRLPSVGAESPKAVNPSQIGLAVSPESVVDPSPASSVSAQSAKSTSKLLPMVPSKNLKIAPQKFMPQRSRPESAWTKIEDDPQLNVDNMRFLSPPQQQQSTFTTSVNDSNKLLSEPAKAAQVPMLKLKIPTRPSLPRQPSQREPNPSKHDSSQSTRTIIQDEPQILPPTVRVIAPPPKSVPRNGVAPRTGDSSETSRSYIPSYYMRNESTEMPSLASAPHKPGTNLPPAPAVSRQMAPLPPPPPLPKPPVRKNTRDSSASGTSIETSFSEEPTPPEEVQPVLTPISEGSPLSGLRYPKVPRPSNQSVPRHSRSPSKENLSPVQERPPSPPNGRPGHVRSDSSTSLVEKRKGPDAATDLQNRLWITGSRGKTVAPVDAPHEGWPIRASSRTEEREFSAPKPRGNGQEMVMKSPLWEPKLTPKRGDGGDMIIEVC